MFDRIRDAFAEGPWLRSWKVLIGLSALYAVGSIVVAIVVIATIPPDASHAAGFAAFALMLLAGVALVAFLASLAFGYLLRSGRAKPAVSVVVILAGAFVYRASGWFEGFLPAFLIGLAAGLLGLREAYVERSAS